MKVRSLWNIRTGISEDGCGNVGGEGCDEDSGDVSYEDNCSDLAYLCILIFSNSNTYLEKIYIQNNPSRLMLVYNSYWMKLHEAEAF